MTGVGQWLRSGIYDAVYRHHKTELAWQADDRLPQGLRDQLDWAIEDVSRNVQLLDLRVQEELELTMVSQPTLLPPLGSAAFDNVYDPLWRRLHNLSNGFEVAAGDELADCRVTSQTRFDQTTGIHDLAMRLNNIRESIARPIFNERV